MKFCPQCGTNRAGRFCGQCGFDFGETILDKASPAVDVSTDEFVIPPGLIFGKGFNEKKNCNNCGIPIKSGRFCSECV